MLAFNVVDYLHRVKLSQAPKVSVSGLHDVHEAHIRSIPFENFDVVLGRGIDLSEEAMVRKILHSQRGGYCFETNGLLRLALESFGFSVTQLLARVHFTGEATARTHLLLMVTIGEEKWLVDAGFGPKTPLSPLRFTLGVETELTNGTYSLIKDDLFGFMLQFKQVGHAEWTNLYSFDLSYVCQADIECANHFTSTHASSALTTTCLASRPFEGGSLMLKNHSLTKQVGDRIVEVVLPAGPEYCATIAQEFEIVLDAEYADFLPFQAST